MFIDNKYCRLYYNIINRAKSRDLDKSVYTEKHHVIPKSLGGTNDESNLVKLTAREHFIVHLMLPKFTEGKSKTKMVLARWRMCNSGKTDYKVSSRSYEFAKIERSIMLSQLRGEDHFNYGRKTGRTSESFTEEWKRNLSLSAKGKASGEKNGMYGKKSPSNNKELFNNGIVAKYFVPGSEPEGFTMGRIPGTAISTKKGLRWYNNGHVNRQFRDNVPSDFIPGRIKNSK